VIARGSIRARRPVSPMISTLNLRVKAGRIARISTLLQRGFFVNFAPGSTLAAVLRDAGFAPDYVAERVQTIFVDGRVIDDPGNEIVGDGAVIALSSAMPGLAGAIFRRGKSLAGLRSAIPGGTRRKDHRAPGPGSERDPRLTARIKLFNLVAEEMGPELLGAGVLMDLPDVREELKARQCIIEESIAAAELDGKPLEIRSLFDGDFAGYKIVLLSAA
jgi:hypothetical protein